MTNRALHLSCTVYCWYSGVNWFQKKRPNTRRWRQRTVIVIIESVRYVATSSVVIFLFCCCVDFVLGLKHQFPISNFWFVLIYHRSVMKKFYANKKSAAKLMQWEERLRRECATQRSVLRPIGISVVYFYLDQLSNIYL